jgi:hypothetical protein
MLVLLWYVHQSKVYLVVQFQVPITIPSLEPRIRHTDAIALWGSCFTEHMSAFLSRYKFSTLQNSHGIVFNPMSVCRSISDCIDKKEYTQQDLFFLNEYWHSWYHHSDFSELNLQDSLDKMNHSIRSHHDFLQKTSYLILTLGSAFAYRHKATNQIVSNNHRAPAQEFEKELLSIDSICSTLESLHKKIHQFNPSITIIYTVSPVRHIRDGVIENNRSKARLIEAVHSLSNSYYFPAYELIIDVLRDYRFYDIDMVHPNYQATAFVWEKFVEHCIDPSMYPLMKPLDQLYKAKHHRPKSTESAAHKKFMFEHVALCQQLRLEYPYLDLAEELQIFQS